MHSWDDRDNPGRRCSLSTMEVERTHLSQFRDRTLSQEPAGWNCQRWRNSAIRHLQGSTSTPSFFSLSLSLLPVFADDAEGRGT